MPYKTIPVDEETYADVQRLAGKRGMGAQVKAWADRELATCDHQKIPVTVEYYPGADVLSGKPVVRDGWYCETCRRVYQRFDNEDIAEAAPVAKTSRRQTRVSA